MTEVWLLVDFPDTAPAELRKDAPGIVHMLYENQEHLEATIGSIIKNYRDDYGVDVTVRALSAQESLYPRAIISMRWPDWATVVGRGELEPEFWVN